MILYPAIDLLGGKVVRLVEGRRDRATVYDPDPVAVARRWAEAGAEWLHVVDLEGAFEGRPVHAAAIAAIARTVAVPIQVGGGLRDDAAVAMVLDAGACRAIVGTRAAADPAGFRDLCRKFPGRIAAAVDARDGRVAVAGWTEATGLDAVEAAVRLAADGACAILYTDVARDGRLEGPDVALTRRLAAACGVPVIAAGGVTTIADILALREAGAAGAVLGKALYEGRLDLAGALGIVSARGR